MCSKHPSPDANVVGGTGAELDAVGRIQRITELHALISIRKYASAATILAVSAIRAFSRSKTYWAVLGVKLVLSAHYALDSSPDSEHSSEANECPPELALSLYARTANFTRFIPLVIPFFKYMRLKWAFNVRKFIPSSFAISWLPAPVSNRSTICRSFGVKFTHQCSRFDASILPGAVTSPH